MCASAPVGVVLGKGNVHQQNVAVVEARIDGQQACHAFDHQTGREEHDHGERHFRRHEPVS